MKISELPHIDPLWGYLELKDGSLVALPKQAIKELQAENERLKGELQQSETKCNNLRYALARLRWEHSLDMESMIDQLYTERPSSWMFYYKSKVYWYNKWQELKKKLKEK